MKTYGNMRDLLAGSVPVEPARTPAEERAGVALPGDPVDEVGNPYVGRNPQALLRLLRSGTLPPAEEERVRSAISVHESLTGDFLTGGIERKVPIPNRKRDRAPAREVDADVAANPDFDPELAEIFR